MKMLQLLEVGVLIALLVVVGVFVFVEDEGTIEVIGHDDFISVSFGDDPTPKGWIIESDADVDPTIEEITDLIRFRLAHDSRMTVNVVRDSNARLVVCTTLDKIYKGLISKRGADHKLWGDIFYIVPAL